MKKLYVFAAVFVLANIVDVILTLAVLNHGGAELNPVMGFFIEGGIWKTLAWKVGLPVVVAGILIRKRRLASLVILAAAFVLICGWNSFAIIH